MVCACARAVADELHASDDFTEGEESYNLSCHHSGNSKLLVVQVAELAKGLEWVRRSCRAGVLHGVDKVLSVCLECSRITLTN